MLRFDETSAECLVLTFKEGLLAAVAHDLKIRVSRFAIEIDEERRSVVGRFDPSSLRVVCAVSDGRDAPETLSAANRAEIESSIARYVLEPARHPEIRFASRSVEDRAGGGYSVDGTLSLHGVERPLRVEVRRVERAHVAEARLHQPDFGIEPYRAMLGALRVQAEVAVRLTLPDRA